MPESSSTHPPFSVATSQLQDEVEFFLQRKSNPSPTAPHNYQRWRAGCSVHHVFSGPSYKYTFDIIQGCLCIKGQRVCIVDKPKLVILDQSGSIKSVRELTVDYPKPTGKPEDIAALVKSAQKFADRFQKN